MLTHIAYTFAVVFNVGFLHEWEINNDKVMAFSITVTIIIFLVNLYRKFDRSKLPGKDRKVFPKFMLHRQKKGSGFFFGVRWWGFFRYYITKPMNVDGNILVAGSVGSGKSKANAKHQFESWNAPIFAIDIKGELSEHYAALFKRGIVDRPFIIFDPTNPKSCGYDPFKMLRIGGENKLVQNAREIAQSIIPLPPSVKERVWIRAGQNFLTATILYFFGLGKDFSTAMKAIQLTPMKKLLEEVMGSNNENAKAFMVKLVGLEMKVIAGVGMEIGNELVEFSVDPLIVKAMRNSLKDKNCFSWSDLEHSHIFLRIPQDMIEQWGNVITLMINQLIRTLERRPDNTTPEGKKLLPILLLLDELARFGKVSSLLGAFTTLRSKCVTFAIYLQSLSQFGMFYSSAESETIIDNCDYIAILKANGLTSKNFFSELAGTYELKEDSYSVYYDAGGILETGRAKKIITSREPYMRPEDFSLLKTDFVLMNPEGYSRVDKIYAPDLIC